MAKAHNMVQNLLQPFGTEPMAPSLLQFLSFEETRRVTRSIGQDSATLANDRGHRIGAQRGRASALLTLFTALATASCGSGEPRNSVGSGGSGGSRSDASTAVITEDAGLGWIAPPEDAGPTYAPTFYAVYFEVLRPSCGVLFCHLAPGYFAVSTPELAYQTLVNAPATSDTCRSTGLMRIAPGQPDQSLLYLKITNPPCGKQMPLSFGVSVPLDPREVEQIRQWILRGAPEVEAAIPDASTEATPSSDATLDRAATPDAPGG